MDTFTARWTRTRLYPVLVLSLGRTQRKWTFQRNREVASLCNAVSACLWNNVPRRITSSSPLFLLLVPLWYTKVYAIMSSLVQTRENRMASIPSSIPVQVFWVFNMVLINIVLFVVVVSQSVIRICSILRWKMNFYLYLGNETRQGNQKCGKYFLGEKFCLIYVW